MPRRKQRGPLNGAPSQYDRSLDAGDPDDVKIDDRSFSELLNFAVQFGSLIRFYDLNDRPDGDWAPFFLTDPTMILASVQSMDLRSLEERFLALIREARSARGYERKLEILGECFQLIVRIGHSIEGWLGGAQINPKSRAARLFARHAADVIGSDLGHQLRRLKANADGLAARATTDSRLHLDFSAFGSVWSSGSSAAPLEGRAGHSRQHDIDQLILVVDTVFRAFFEALHGFQMLAAKHLPETLEDSNHKPQIALYIAFVRLFQTAQRTINTITARFTRFYYHDVLREKKAGPVPDSVYLTLAFDPAAGIGVATVPEGTQFPAGQEPDGTAILYASDAAVSVTPAALAVVRSIRLAVGPLYEAPLISPSTHVADSPPPGLAPRLVLGTQIDVKVMNGEAAGKVPPDGLLAWPPFGATATGTSGIATTTAVTLGFAVASRYLLLTGGDRIVQLVFDLTDDAARLLEPNLADLAYATGLTSTEVFEQTISQSFDLWLSTEAGWFHVTSYACSAEFGSRRSGFSLQFSLDRSAPSIAPYDPSPNAPPPAAAAGADDLNPDAGLPTLKAWLRQKEAILAGPDGEVATYPLSLLCGLTIESIEVRTETSDLTNLQVSTISGPVNTAATYPVFGAIPVTGSFLQFTNPELFAKTPDAGSLKISLTWLGLPANPDGFYGYYQGYVLGLNGEPSPTPLFDNQTFAADLRVINPGTWDIRHAGAPDVLSPPGTDSVFLFRTADDCSNPIPAPDGPLCPVSEFETFDLDRIPRPEYYDPASSAIRLTLTEPSYAFGNILYSANVLNAVVSELPETEPQKAASAPCEPLADAANSLGTCLPAEGQPPPSKVAVRQVTQQTQEKLIQAAQSSLSRSLSPLGEDVASWIQQTFTVSGSNAAPYRAQKIRARLQSALAAIESDLSGHTSPPGLPRAAAAPIRNCIRMLQAVVLIQQALDHCAAEGENSWNKCIQTQLAACREKLLQSQADCAQKTQSLPYPNPPWTPQAKGLSISYRAHCRVSRFDADDNEIRFFELLPYGGYREASFDSPQLLLLPVTSDGSLELGFSGLDAPQQLSMLVQTCAGGAAAPEISWQYLSSNAWLPLRDAAIPLDTTNGLQNTGIVTLNLPAADAGAQTGAPTTYRWIRATTPRPDDFPEAIGIYPHPLLATWVSGASGSGQHLGRPLPPYTIKSSVPAIAGIKTINQPIESFGGRPAENDKTFRIRISERLRHKDRAILAWDYERLVLEDFPFIWKVKALPASSTTADHQPGRVLVMVVAGPGGVQISDPTEPLVPADMLEHIRESLTAVASPFACIQVVNPTYVRIHVTAEVMFQNSSAGGGGIDRLNTDLVQYLSPWFYDAERASTQGRYASEDAITQFIQTRAYIAALVDIRFDYDPPPSSLDWYFLTSAKSHSITQADSISNSKGAVQPCSQ